MKNTDKALNDLMSEILTTAMHANGLANSYRHLSYETVRDDIKRVRERLEAAIDRLVDFDDAHEDEQMELAFAREDAQPVANPVICATEFRHHWVDGKCTKCHEPLVTLGQLLQDSDT